MSARTAVGWSAPGRWQKRASDIWSGINPSGGSFPRSRPFRAAANEVSVPMILKPDFWRTRSEPALSLAARACSGRTGTKSRSSAIARVAMPRPQGRTFDPVCDLALPLEDEAGDGAYEPPVAGYCPQGSVGRASQRGHVGIECAPVVGVLGGDRRHQDRRRVTLLVEQRVQIGVLDRPQRDNRPVLVSILRWTSAKRSSPAIQQRPSVGSDE